MTRDRYPRILHDVEREPLQIGEMATGEIIGE
jgi:hypothetical protein